MILYKISLLQIRRRCDLPVCDRPSEKFVIFSSLKRMVLSILMAALFLVPAVVPGWAQPAENTIAARRAGALAAALSAPSPRPNCPTAPFAWACLWGKLSFGLVGLALGGPDPAAERQRAALLDEALSMLNAAIARNEAEKGAEMEDAREGFAFHFLTPALLHRLVAQFGPTALGGDGRLPAPQAEAVLTAFGGWARSNCRMGDADVALVWRPWGSENHDIQRVYACWAAAELLARAGRDNAFRYQDGSTPAAQARAWSAFLKALITARGTHGGLVEYFSPTYAKYSLNVFYNVRDFAADAELRTLAGNFITLWWALWAQEQQDGAHGGSRARQYYEDQSRTTRLDGGLGWVYAGLGPRPERAPHPSIIPMLVSSYEPPPIVGRIMRESLAAQPAGFEVWAEVAGLAAAPMRQGRYTLSPDLGAVRRYAFVAPGFVMGASLSPRLGSANWTAISSQNRWNGLAFTDSREPAIDARPEPKGRRSTYNAVQVAQSRGTQIVQTLPAPFSRDAGRMQIRLSPTLERVERGGWIFVRGSAYGAVRPAFGGYAQEGRAARFHLQDERSPVIIQAGARSAYPSFEAFQQAVLAAPLAVTAQAVTFTGLDGAGALRMPLEGEGPPLRDGAAIAPPPGWTLYSPFLRQKQGESQVEIGFDGETMRLAF